MWRLYLVGGAMAFRDGRMGVDQILAVRPDGDGASSMPPVRRPRVVLTGFSLSNFVAVSGFSLLAVAILMAVTAFVGRRQGRVSVVDTAWGLGFVVVALVAAVVGDGPLWRRLLVLLLVAVWGGRLARHMHTRNQGKGEDPRYEAMLADQPGDPFLVAIRKVYLVQGVAVWFVSLPLQVSAASGDGLVVVAVLGAAVWLLGVVFEAVGDAQLARFKADARNKGTVMDRGLWAMDPTPELLRRLGRLVGALPRRRQRLARCPHRPVAGRHDVLPRLRHRCATAREGDVEAARLPGVPAAHELLHPPAAEAH